MKKRIISSVTAAALAVSAMSVLVSADNTAAESTKQSAVQITLHSSNDELLEMFLCDRLSDADGDEEFSYYANYKRSQLSGYDLQLYDILKEALVKIAEGKSNDTKFTIQMTVPVISEALDTAYTPSERISDILSYVCADCPQEMYWYDKTTWTTFSTSSAFTTAGMLYEIELCMPVSADYALGGGTGGYKTDPAKISAVNSSVSNAKKIVAENSDKTDFQKLVSYKEKICALTSYNDDAAKNNPPYGDPWQMIYVFDGDPSTNVVCEGYAKAFKFLCDNSSFSRNIECLTVSGEMEGGAHMWNVVSVDGVSYMADVTNCDEGTIGAPDSLFLKGMTAVSPGKSYSITAGGQNITYTYYSDTINLYTGSILSVSSSNLDFSEPDITGINNFVERLYTTMLGRASEPAGKAHNVSLIKDKGYTAADVASGFVLGDELRLKNLSNTEFVTRMYRTFLDREADTAGLADWVNALDSGCSYAYILNSFTGSQEFGKLCAEYGITPGSYAVTEARDRNRKLTEFTSRMYTKALGRAYDINGLNDWTNRYLTGKAKVRDIAYGFIFSQEFKNKNLSDSDYVDTLYRTFFNREPDAGGKANWMNQLANGKSREDVMYGFVGSQECINLVASFGI